jgi:(E)-4-hydroxy-3-methylbut-2-enyl-diphosphate synthase
VTNNGTAGQRTTRRSRPVFLGDLQVGGGAPVSIQSMTNTRTADVPATAEQIARLEAAGCEVVRLAVPDCPSAAAITELKKTAGVPLVADIHFDYRLALAAVEAGVDGLRINPGNIGSAQRVEAVARAAGERGVPIRIGVNSGSLPRQLMNRFGGATPEAMVECALEQAAQLEGVGFGAIKISLKASDVTRTVQASRVLARRVDYPLHLGVTEAGAGRPAVVRSTLGIGLLLAEGIGDTIRVSLTGDPVSEIGVARDILQGLGLRSFGPEFISCPSCGRVRAEGGEEFAAMAAEIAEGVSGLRTPLRLAVMGCEVNGPGEAREADLGVALGNEEGVLFCNGTVLRKIPLDRVVAEFIAEAARLDAECEKRSS